MIAVGVRELKLHLGHYLNLVKKGGTLMITDRGRPIAEITPIKVTDQEQQAILQEMVMNGELTWREFKRFENFEPFELDGQPVSVQIVEDRADRL